MLIGARMNTKRFVALIAAVVGITLA